MSQARPRRQNPISTAVREWVHLLPAASALGPRADAETLIAEAPKRWVIYSPMVLLPSGSLASTAWTETLAWASRDCQSHLWLLMLRSIAHKTRETITHLAVSDAIPQTVADDSDDKQARPNIVRSPIGLRILHGDFGPSQTPSHLVADDDLARAFWTSTKQNGIHQTWAPRWTMFSRGNVKEKARLLAFHESPSIAAGEDHHQLAHRRRPRTALSKTWAVDLYAGIGYFVFSYVKLGMSVLCWEINPWSVEGLRRGARANGWPVRVVKGEDLRKPTYELVSDGDTIVVFLENNQGAARRVCELRSQNFDLQVSHVNCGLLPKSDDSWKAACEVLGRVHQGWLHLHENVGAGDVDRRRAEIQAVFDTWEERDKTQQAAKVEHVEFVKTFAPHVWHCVFDVYITTSSIETDIRSP